MNKFEKYLAIFRLSFIHTIKNYKALVGLSVFLMTCLVIFANLWKFVAANRGIVTFSPEQLLWYIALNEWILVSVPDIHEDMEHDLRSGRHAYLLPRPVSYLGSVFAEAAGALSVNLIVLGLVTFLFTWYQAGALPFHFSGLLLSAAFAIAAGVLSLLFRMLIGLSAFWLNDSEPLFWIWEKLLFMFGGLMIPLSIYPLWMQNIAVLTPFPAILGERSALVFEFSSRQVSLLSLSYVFWGTICMILILIVYRRALRILNVEGG